MRLAVCRECHVSARRSPTYSRLQQEQHAGGPGWGGVGGERCDQQSSTGVCVTQSIEKSLRNVGGLLQLQAYNTGQMTPAIR